MKPFASGGSIAARRSKIASLTRQTVRILAGAICNTLLPPRCQACGRSTASMAMGAGENPAACRPADPVSIFESCLCKACRQSFTAVESPFCPRCGRMFMSRLGADHLCDHCSRYTWHFGKARAAGVFDRCLATLVHRLKYSGHTGLAKPLGLIMLKVLQEHWSRDEIDCVVPVPLHPKRLRARGFNQSFLLTQVWTVPTPGHLGAWPGLQVDTDLLRRIRPTASQTGLDRRERATNVKAAFGVNPEKRVAGLRLLVVDDVFTTGSTVNECARVLMNAGARRVDVLTLARTHIGYGVLYHG